MPGSRFPVGVSYLEEGRTVQLLAHFCAGTCAKIVASARPSTFEGRAGGARFASQRVARFGFHTRAGAGDLIGFFQMLGRCLVLCLGNCHSLVGSAAAMVPFVFHPWR